ncbi:MAG TPA: hypothetical protein EYH38_11645 [Leucothrix sp.]|nr:hypothetical protein [Leucothrix sp.]
MKISDMKKSLLLTLAMLITTVTTTTVTACPFDEANVEVTVLAKDEIAKAVNAGNYAQATAAIKKNKMLYDYFGHGIYTALLKASANSDGAKINSLLDKTLYLEVKELLGQVDKEFSNYQKSRLKLIKAKKHLKALTREKAPTSVMKKILKTLGNPGLMGVGKRNPDKAAFSSNSNKLLGMIRR